MKGILIMAVGHPYYGRLAYNLALSIKSVQRDAQIAVVHSDRSLNHLSSDQLRFFDHLIELPEGLPEGCGTKLWANELTPFKKTILLDADMLWLPKRTPDDLFKELDGINFTAISEGYFDYQEGNHQINEKYFFWADPLEIKSKYKVKADKIYQWRSEVVYFEKATKIFSTAQKVFLNPGLPSMKQYATGVADELGINVACAVHDIHPHVFRWEPSYWHMINGGHIPSIPDLLNKHYLISFGSNQATGNSKKIYDKLVRVACYKFGLQHVFPLASKREWLPERTKM